MESRRLTESLRALNRHIEGFLAVTHWEHDGAQYVHVYQSLRVEEDDEWLAPTVDVLRRCCHSVVRDEWVRDVDMIGLRAKATTYRVFDRHPPTVDHVCRLTEERKAA